MKENIISYSLEISDLLVWLDMPRIPAAIIGLLLISQPPEITFENVQEQLNISKATVSTAMRYLEALDVIVYQTPVGSRKRFIQLKPMKLANYIMRRMVYFGKLTHSLQMIAQAHDNSSYKQEISSVANLCQQLDTGVMNIINKWESEQ